MNEERLELFRDVLAGARPSSQVVVLLLEEHFRSVDAAREVVSTLLTVNEFESMSDHFMSATRYCTLPLAVLTIAAQYARLDFSSLLETPGSTSNPAPELPEPNYAEGYFQKLQMQIVELEEQILALERAGGPSSLMRAERLTNKLVRMEEKMQELIGNSNQGITI